MAQLYCNACWKKLEEQYVLTECNHVYCIEHAKQILRADDSTCPRCDNVLSNRTVQVINTLEEPFNEGCLFGRTPKELAKCIYHAVDFSNQQTELMMAAQREELTEKSKTVQQQMYTKLEELHNAYKKAKVRANELTQERDALEQDKKELQEKYSEKTRQKRKLEEMYGVVKTELDWLKNRRMDHNQGRGDTAGFMQLPSNHLTSASRSLHTSASAGYQMPTSAAFGLNTPGPPSRQAALNTPGPSHEFGDQQVSRGAGLLGRESRSPSTLGLRGSQQQARSREYTRTPRPAGEAYSPARTGKLSSSLLSLGKTSPASSGELFGIRR